MIVHSTTPRRTIECKIEYFAHLGKGTYEKRETILPIITYCTNDDDALFKAVEIAKCRIGEENVIISVSYYREEGGKKQTISLTVTTYDGTSDTLPDIGKNCIFYHLTVPNETVSTLEISEDDDAPLWCDIEGIMDPIPVEIGDSWFYWDDLILEPPAQKEAP